MKNYRSSVLLLISAYLIIVFLLSGCRHKNIFAPAPPWLWATSAGGAFQDEINCISTDTNNNAYVTGYFSGPCISLGNINLKNADSTGKTADVVIAKFNASGKLLWATSAGGAAEDKGWSICTDAGGNSYITGVFKSPAINFGNTVLFNSDSTGNTGDIFVVKLNKEGSVLWAKSMGGKGNDSGWGISTDATGNAYLTGFYSSTLMVLENTTLTNADTAGNDNDILVVKYDSLGNVVWAKSAGGNDEDRGYGICSDRSGNVFVTGFFKSPSVTFDNHTLFNVNPYNSTADIYVVKIDAMGNALWIKGARGNAKDISQSIKTDASGNAYITGRFESKTIMFGTTILNNAGGNDCFIAKYDSLGMVLWAKSAGGTGDDYGHHIYTDANGNSFLTGATFSPSLHFGNYTLTSTKKASAVMVAAYDADGNVLWAKSADNLPDNGEGRGICKTTSGSLLVAGTFFDRSIKFNSVLANADTSGITGDMFVAKIK